MSTVGVGKQCADVRLLRSISISERRKLVHQHSRRPEDSSTDVAIQNRLAGFRPLCGRRFAELRNPGYRGTEPGPLSPPFANHKTNRWNGKGLSLDEFTLIALSGQPPAQSCQENRARCRACFQWLRRFMSEP